MCANKNKNMPSVSASLRPSIAQNDIIKLCWNLPEILKFSNVHNGHVRFHLFMHMQLRPNQVNASTLIFDLSAIIDMAIKTNSSVHNKKMWCGSISILGADRPHTHTQSETEYIWIELQTNDEGLATMKQNLQSFQDFLFGSFREPFSSTSMSHNVGYNKILQNFKQ